MLQIILALIIIIVEGIFFSTTTSIPPKKAQYIFAWIVFIQLFIISGFRHMDIGNDTLSYIISFNNININSSLFKFEGRFEIGYQFLTKFIRLYISSGPIVLLIITSLIIQSLNTRFMYKYSTILWLSVFLFITFRFYFFSVSAVRQGIAVAICFFAYDYLLKNDIKRVVIIVLFAFFFHYSAIIFLLLIFIQKIDFSYKHMAILGLITIILFLSMSVLSDWLFSSMSYGIDYYNQGIELKSTLGSTLIALNLFVVFIFGFIYKESDSTTPTTNNQVELWAVYIALIIQVLAIKFGILIRFTYYFAPFAVLMIPNIISRIKNQDVKQLSIYFWVLFAFIQFIIILYYRPEWYNFYPYKFYWE